MLNYPPEINLILACAKSVLNAQEQEYIKNLLQEKINEDYLLELAKKHKLKPLLYWHLNQICTEKIPEELEIYCKQNLQRNQVLTEQLIKILQLFDNNRIKALPYKGPSLAYCTHKNISLRHWWDLDILVDEKDFLEAENILLKEKYTHKPSRHSLEWEKSFLDPDFGMTIDLHQRITLKNFPCTFKFQQLWQNHQYLSIRETKIKIIQPEDLLIILCVQVVKDTWENKIRLVKYSDIAELIFAYKDLNWAEILLKAKLYGCERILFVGLFLTKNLIEITLPSIILEKIKSDIFIKLYGQAYLERLFIIESKKINNKSVVRQKLNRQLERAFLALPIWVNLP
jgi:hypothetical protein